MDAVLTCHSESHPTALDVLRDELADTSIDVDELTIEPGGVDADAEADLLEALPGHQALYIRAGEMTRHVFESVDDLELVVTSGSGFDHIDLDAATETGVVVAHQPGAPAPGVVEHTFGLLFSILNDFPGMFEATAAGEWQGARGARPEFGSRTLGVVGLGTIGFPVARIAASAFDARVLGHDPFVAGTKESPIYPRHDRDEVEDAGVELVGKQELFGRADVVTLHVPLRDDSHHLVGRTELESLSSGYLINAARGPVVDEAALAEALADGLLEGVALDVLENEPPDRDNPLLAYDRVSITPHVAAWTDSYLDRSARLAAEKVKTIAGGDVPGTVVNPEVLSD
ncbi:MAG: NAD(P)-dependent oxidoreductase [Halanaeroarchaeum sp.]